MLPFVSFIKAQNCPDAWIRTLKEIWENGEIYEVKRGSELGENRKISAVIEIEHPEQRPLLHSKAKAREERLNEYFLDYMWLPKSEKTRDWAHTFGDRLRKPFDQIEEAIKD